MEGQSITLAVTRDEFLGQAAGCPRFAGTFSVCFLIPYTGPRPPRFTNAAARHEIKGLERGFPGFPQNTLVNHT